MTPSPAIFPYRQLHLPVLPAQSIRKRSPRPLRQTQHRRRQDLRLQQASPPNPAGHQRRHRRLQRRYRRRMKQINADQISSADMFGTRDFLKDNYLYRYAGAKLGLYGNSRQDAIYFGYFVDADHQPLDASKSSYELHFAKGALPDHQGLLVAHHVRRQDPAPGRQPAEALPAQLHHAEVLQVRPRRLAHPLHLNTPTPAPPKNPTGSPPPTAPSTQSSASTCPATQSSTAPGRSRR